MSVQNYPWKGFVGGSVASILSGIIVYPIDLVRVRMHLDHNKNTTFNLIKNIYKNEGFLKLYSGITSSLVRQITYNGAKFGAYDYLSCKLKDEHGHISFNNKIIAGIGGGVASVIAGMPSDLIMTRMQSGKNVHTDFIKKPLVCRIIKEEGVLTLWKGLLPATAKSSIISVSQISLYNQIKDDLGPRGYNLIENSIVISIISSSISGIVAAIVSNPFDVVKSRLQTTNKKVYSSTSDCFYKMGTQEGITSFYKGLQPNIIKQVPLNIIRFLCIERMKILLDY